MRLIDADELLTDNTWEWFDEWGNCTAAGKAIMDAPTIDAEPVVRCIDCIFWYDCEYPFKSENGFCCCGEREEP